MPGAYPWNRGGYTSGDREVPLPVVPSGPAPGARGQERVKSATVPPRPKNAPAPPPVPSGAMELPADTSWLRMEPASRPLLRPRWTVEGRMTDSSMRDPFDQPTFLTRRRAERYARRHTCDHITYTIRPVSRCACGGELHPAPPTPVAATVADQPPDDFEG